jgi:hypothetical protein
LRRVWRFLGWFVVVDALITIFGETTGPLLLSLAADGAVGLLIIRSCMEMRAAMPAAPAGGRTLLLLFPSLTAVSKYRFRKRGY